MLREIASLHVVPIAMTENGKRGFSVEKLKGCGRPPQGIDSTGKLLNQPFTVKSICEKKYLYFALSKNTEKPNFTPQLRVSDLVKPERTEVAS